MIKFIAKLFIKDYQNISSPAVRRGYGILSGCVGIGLNLLLFAGKLLAGMISRSIAVTADAVNNLSDAGSSVVTLLGFKLAAQEPDRDHPFGHGRLEYISGLVVSMVILLMGVELGKTSLEKILHPEEVAFSPVVAGVLCVSILVKLYMVLYNRRNGRYRCRQLERLPRHHRRAAGHLGRTFLERADRWVVRRRRGAVYPLVRLRRREGNG